MHLHAYVALCHSQVAIGQFQHTRRSILTGKTTGLLKQFTRRHEVTCSIGQKSQLQGGDHKRMHDNIER